MTYPAGNRRAISAEGFARLLDRLHADPAQAAHEYERLRRGLMKFFDWRGRPASYVRGIARIVLLERRRGPAFSSIEEAPQATLAVQAAADGGSRLHDCFDRCLGALPDESRTLVLRYYEGERAAKISNRRQLASMLGVTESALRNRVQRLRDRLEDCVRACSSHPVGQTS